MATGFQLLRYVFAEGTGGGFFGVEYLKNCEQLGDLKQVADTLAEAGEFDGSAGVAGGGK